MEIVKNKGFTLVEVLGVFTILAIILLVSLPAVTKSLKTKEERSYEQFKKTTEVAAESYYESHRSSYSSAMLSQNDSIKISIGTLKGEGFLADVPSKLNGKTIQDTMYVQATLQQDGTIKYEFKE